jgi:hypothetical protein
MPLLDHFHDPYDTEATWESFHSMWTTSIAAQLNRSLPRRFCALAQIHLGRHVEADVVEVDLGAEARDEPRNGPGGGVAVKAWAAPAATLVLPALFPDDIYVPVIDTERPRRPVAVVELVSPRNKDRPDARAAFAARSSAYFQYGLGLIIVDVVTTRRGNMHNELMELLKHPPTSHLSDDVLLYTTAYRPRRENEENLMDVWTVPLAVGQPLPTMPLALRGAMTVPVDLKRPTPTPATAVGSGPSRPVDDGGFGPYRFA